MQKHFIITAILLCIYPLHVHAVTLKEAMNTALEQHPWLKISNTHIQGAQGDLKQQGSYAYNPELSVEPQRRRLNGGGSSNDYYITLSQGIELGGKQGYREQSAQAVLESVQLESKLTHQQVAFNAAKSLVALYFSAQELDWRKQQADTLLQLHQAISRQMKLGNANQLDVNLSQAALIQAIQTKAQAAATHTKNQWAYAMAIGTSSGIPTTRAELPTLLEDWQPPAEPISVAMHARLDLAMKRQRLRQSLADAELANASKIPDLNIGLMAGKEAGEQLISFHVTMPIPVWNSHDGAYRSALSQASALQTEMEWSEQRVKLEVQEALWNHATAMQALQVIQQIQGNVTSDNSIALAKAAFDAGELDIEALVMHINQRLESHIHAMTTLQQGWLARIRLAEVLSHPEYILQGASQ